MTINEKTQLLLDEIGILQNKKPVSANAVKANYLKQRLKEYTEEELIAYVNWIWGQWFNWELRDQYFRPETLFQKKRVAQAMEQVELGEAPLSPTAKETVTKTECTLDDYRSYVLKSSRYFGYHYRRMTDLKKKKIDKLIIEDYQSGKPAYHALNVSIFENIRKESHDRPENKI